MKKLFVIVLLGLVLRLINLNQSLWLDEAITAMAVKTNTFIQLLTQFSIGDFHPPLFYLILKLWTDLFGYSETALRFLPVIFGTATIFFVYKIGEKLINKKGGLIAAILMATNPLAIYYSQEARMYSLAMLAVTAAVWFFIQKKWFWFWVCFWVASMSDYLPLLLLPVFFIAVQNRRFFLKTFLLYLVAVVVWLPFLYRQLLAGLSLAKELPLWSQVVGGFSFKSLLLTFVKFIFGRISIANKIVYGAVAGGAGVLYAWILSRSRNKLLWLWLVVPLGIGFILSLKISVFSYFRFLFVLPAFLLLLAEGLKNRKLLIIVVILIQFGAVVYFDLNPQFWRENWRDATKYMETYNSLAIMPSLSQAAPLTYYGFTDPLVDVTHTINLTGVQTVYLVRYVPEIFDPNNIAAISAEKAGFKFSESRDFNGVVIWKYTK